MADASAAAQAIRALRLRRGWTLEELSQKVGTSPAGLSKRERGDIRVKTREWAEFAAAFEMSLTDFEAAIQEFEREEKRGLPVINRLKTGLVVSVADCDNVGEYVEFVPPGNITDDRAFAVIITDDDMEPALYEGDYVIFAPLNVPTPAVRLSEDAVVLVRLTSPKVVGHKKQACVIGRYRVRAGGVEIKPENAPAVKIKADEIVDMAVAVERRTSRI